MSDSDEFSDAHSITFISSDCSESQHPPSSQLSITNNASDIFNIKGPIYSGKSFEEDTVGDEDGEGEEDSEDFFDVIEQLEVPLIVTKSTLNTNKKEIGHTEENTNTSKNSKEDTEKNAEYNEDNSDAIRPPFKGISILEFLQEEEEDEEIKIKADSPDKNQRETIYEFLASDEGEEQGEVGSESSLSRLQTELELESLDVAENKSCHETNEKNLLNHAIPLNLNLKLNEHGLAPRRRESLLRRANPLASFFVATADSESNSLAADSDSIISELTEAFTIRTELSETRLSRAPSIFHEADYLKLAKRCKPVPVKTKSKQKSEFGSLLLIQELDRDASAATNAQRSHLPTDPSKAIFVLKFSPDGQFLASAGAEGILKIWSLFRLQLTADSEGDTPIPRLAAIFESEPVQVLRGHTAEILDCAWSSNNFLLTASMDKTVRLWHHSRSGALGIFQHLDYVTSVAFHPRDPRIFISGSLDCKLRLWSIQDRTILHWNELPPGNYITAVAFTRSGSTVIAGTSSGTALIFDTDNLRYNTQILVRSSRSQSVGKKITSIESLPGQYDNDERIIISSNDSRIRMYSLRDKNVIYKYKGHENISSQIGASLSTDADYVLSGSEDCRVYLWRSDGKFQKKSFFGSFRKDHINSYESFKAHSNPVTAAILAPDCVSNLLQSLQIRPINPLQSGEGKIIVTADVTGQIKVFENNSKLIEYLK